MRPIKLAFKESFSGYSQAVEGLVVSTSWDAGLGRARRAQAVARRLGVPFLAPEERRRRHTGAVYTVEAFRERLVERDGRILSAHPGLFGQKVTLGLEHPLLRAARPRGEPPGDLLDATAGLGQDALHLAAFSARVVAVERQPLLGCLLRGGLHEALVCARPWAEAARRVRVVISEAEAALVACRSGSVDTIFFDPMFEVPRKAGPAFDLFRRQAHPGRLRIGALLEAVRVARKRVIVKVAGSTWPIIEEPDSKVERSGDLLQPRQIPAPERQRLSTLGFNRRVTARAFDYWLIERALENPEWEAPKVRRLGDPSPTPPQP